MKSDACWTLFCWEKFLFSERDYPVSFFRTFEKLPVSSCLRDEPRFLSHHLLNTWESQVETLQEDWISKKISFSRWQSLRTIPTSQRRREKAFLGISVFFFHLHVCISENWTRNEMMHVILQPSSHFPSAPLAHSRCKTRKFFHYVDSYFNIYLFALHEFEEEKACGREAKGFTVLFTRRNSPTREVFPR